MSDYISETTEYMLDRMGLDTDTEYRARLEVWDDVDFSVEIDTAEWLIERAGVEYTPQLDCQYRDHCDRHHLDVHHYESGLSFLEAIGCSGLHGDGEPMTVNTYNHQSSLDTILQYGYGERDFGAIITLQVHRGGDARAHYSRPAVFRVDGYDPCDIMMDAHCTIGCTVCEAGWHSDDSYHFYSNAGGDDLNDYPGLTFDREELETGVTVDGDTYKLDTLDGDPIVELYRDGELVEDIGERPRIAIKRESLHCPQCGGMLAAGW